VAAATGTVAAAGWAGGGVLIFHDGYTMSEPLRRYITFFAIAMVMYIVIDDGLEILARIRIRGESMAEALSQTAHYSLAQPLGTLFALAPFAAIAWISGSLARASWHRAIILMAVCFAVFAFFYYGGHMASERFMQQRKWTAAALAVGFIPFKNFAVVVMALIARLLLGRKRMPTKV
jgi:hypothetical protein